MFARENDYCSAFLRLRGVLVRPHHRNHVAEFLDVGFVPITVGEVQGFDGLDGLAHGGGSVGDGLHGGVGELRHVGSISARKPHGKENR